MSLLARQSRGSSASIIAMGLVVLAFLIISVKYVSPILFYISERLADHPQSDIPVMWDFWWPIYLMVAAQIYYRAKSAWMMVLTLGAARLLWATVVLTLFFSKPEWDFWNLQWLFYEVITVMIMGFGILFALKPTTRDEMVGATGSMSFSR